MRRALESLFPSLAAVTAALLAPWLTGASWATALGAGLAVTLFTAAHALSATRPGWPERSLALLTLGLLVVGSAVALGPVLDAPAWISACLGLGGGALLAAGAAEHARAWSGRETELALLRSRLVRREGDVRAQADRIRRLDRLDPISGLLTRRSFSRALDGALADSSGAREPLVLLLIELPEPLAGPSQLSPHDPGREIGRAVQAAVRGSDAAGRWDDSHLALVLPRCIDARPAVERLRARLTAAGWSEENGVRVAGVSIGPAGPWPSAADLVAAAQGALRAARSGPSEAPPAVWPLNWGLAALAGEKPETMN